MAYVISDECVSCGTCESECPAEAISQGDEHYVIDADACLDCGTCADACPTEAIHPADFKTASSLFTAETKLFSLWITFTNVFF